MEFPPPGVGGVAFKLLAVQEVQPWGLHLQPLSPVAFRCRLERHTTKACAGDFLTLRCSPVNWKPLAIFNACTDRSF
jgi:hypothetical protein